jgi:hypothetical protein
MTTTITTTIEDIEIHLINTNIEDLNNEIKISNILLKIKQYNIYFHPIIGHKIIKNIKTKNTQKKQNTENIYSSVEKEQRNLSMTLPNTHKEDILNYLNETIEILLENNIYAPLNNKSIQYDIINKIPIIVDFKQAIVITKWQSKTLFHNKYKQDIANIIFT